MKHKLIEMLRYMRPEGSDTQLEFCDEFLEPTFGHPDAIGNYTVQVGVNPRLCFTAHHDTVHKTSGMQALVVSNDIISVADPLTSSCLGADCTTGIWLMLNMIEAGIHGTYVVHAAEEVGCRGSSALVFDNPEWLDHTDAVISFDRFGDTSVITHQMGVRTASDEFAKSFADALSLPQLKSDTRGSYTDSNEYARVVAECTNISVGYYNQHSSTETQDLRFAEVLLKHLLEADWSKIVIHRDPNSYEEDWDSWCDSLGSYDYRQRGVSDMVAIVEDNPETVASLLEFLGYTPDSLLDDCDQSSGWYTNSYASRRMM